MTTLDDETEAALEEALTLLKAGKKREAQAIILPLTLRHPNLPDGWYLLGFTVTELEQKRYCFQQVLQLDPTNEAAQRQLEKLILRQTAPVETPVAHKEQPTRPEVENEEDHDEEETEDEQPGTTNIFKVLLAAVTIFGVILVGVLSLYIFFGVRVNNQVNTMFQQRECNRVAEYTPFSNFFPRSTFAPMFSLYEQVDECQARQAVVNAANVQDWSAAHEAAKAYIAQYPQGRFVAEVNEQGGDILLTWSKNLLAQNDFESAIAKVALIGRDFPGAPAEKVVAETILTDHLLWAQHLFAQRDYENAEKTFIMVTSDPGTPLEQAKQAHDALVQLYLAWAASQTENEQYEQALLSYEKARALNPTLMDYDQLQAQVSLKHATTLADANDFDQALAIVDELLAKKPSGQTRTNTLALREKILGDYARSNAAQAQAQIAAAANTICQDKLPNLPIFGINADARRFFVQPEFHFELPQDLLASAPADLHYALCVKQTFVTIETCEYQRGYAAQRNYYVWDVSVREIATGQPLQNNVFQGSTPRNCGDSEPFQDGVTTISIYGETPTAEEIVAWLSKLDLSKKETAQ